MCRRSSLCVLVFIYVGAEAYSYSRKKAKHKKIVEVKAQLKAQRKAEHADFSHQARSIGTSFIPTFAFGDHQVTMSPK